MLTVTQDEETNDEEKQITKFFFLDEVIIK